MNQKFSIVAALSLSFLAVSACKKDEKAESKDKAKGDNVAKVVAENAGEMPKETKPTLPETTVPTADVKMDGLWKHMPKDVDGVLSVNMGKLTGTSLWKQYSPMITAAMNDKMKMSAVKEKCGLDILATLQSIHVGYSSAEEKPIIMVKGIERSVANKCIVAMAKEEGKTVTVKDEGPISVVTAEKKVNGIAWIDDTTLLFVPEKNDKDYLMARIAGADGMDGNAALLGTIAKVKQDAPIWFAGKFSKDSKAGKGLAEITSGEVSSIFGGVGFADGLQINAGIEFASESEAASLKKKIEDILPMAAMVGADAIAKKLKLALSGSDLAIDLNLTTAEITILSDLAKGKLGGMAGGR